MRSTSTVSLGLGLRERIAVLTLAALVLGGGLYPQPGVMSRERAAEEVLSLRNRPRPPAPTKRETKVEQVRRPATPIR